MSEFHKELDQLKNKKSARQDLITSELLKNSDVR